MEVYSKLDQIPCGIASNKTIDGCIVLEGGAFRGLYTAGVLDALMENDINLSCTIGVSAGAMNGVNYVAGNIGRTARINLKYRHDSRYVGVKAIRKNKGIIGFDFVFKQINKTDPLNNELFYDEKKRFIASCTSCVTGEQTFFEKGKCKDIYKAIQASASMPYVSEMVKVEGKPYLDGGCSKAIPYEWALANDCKKIVIVRTRDVNFRKPNELDMHAFRRYRSHPLFANTLSECQIEYNRECDEIEKLTKEGRVFTISPSVPITISRIESNVEKLGNLYHLGYKDAMNCMSELKQYLELSN